jgi:bifunctional non-homologous end joining protein LigD
VAPGSKAGQSARLKSYRAKRDFAATPEPEGGAGGEKSAPRFVIQEHHATRLHWDLRLERDGLLASWAIPRGLPESPGENHLAVATEDHPLAYADFEGEIPKGEYGAGRVTIWDRGTYDTLKWEPRKVEVALHGKRLDARYALFPIASEAEPRDWMIHRMDPPADPGREPMPQRLEPMLAKAGALPAEPGRWAYEIKWDGVRALAYSRPGELRLQSRNLNEITSQYPELNRLNDALSSHAAVLDGEIIAFDENQRPSFEVLQQRMNVTAKAQARRLARSVPVTYVIFDLLWLDGHSLMGLPYLERRECLTALQLAGPTWQSPGHLTGDGSAVLEASAEQGLEGIVAKRLDSTYQPGRRTGTWVKVKNVSRQEFVIGGWLPGVGRRKQWIGALLVGVHDPGGELRYAGRVGTGFSETELERLAGLLAALERPTSPFTAGAPPPRGAVFCEPTLVAEVEFREWTKRGSLRAPSFKGLRQDKPAARIVREKPDAEPSERYGLGGLELLEQSSTKASALVDGRELKLSNLAKLLYPQAGFTKREVIDYYAAVGSVLIGHLEGRPLTVRRWPDGVDAHAFFQKHAPAHRPKWVQTVSISSQRETIDYVLAQDLPTLVWLANLAALELHTPLARADAIEQPTTLVFDLDPGDPATLLECCRVGLQLHGMFENLGLQSYAKTSGMKGLQLYVPLNSADATYAQTKSFARTVAELLASTEPDLVVSRMTKARRTGKVLIDWSQNDRRKTTVCAYSLRAAERPTVSTPVEWDEVRRTYESGRPADLVFEAGDVLDRVAERGDLFAPVLSSVQQLPVL